MKTNGLYIIITVLVLLHLPFLNSDPDKQVDLHTRGAWTDEGLYASQVRNFLNYGNPDIEENTTFIRGPLYDLIRLPFFWIFGQSLRVARLLTLAGVALSLILLTRTGEYRLMGLFIIILGFLQFRLFHFSHYAMSEMLAVSAVIISFVCLDDYIRKGKRRFLFFATLLIAIAWGLKIQFLYLLLLIPGVTVLWYLFGIYQGNCSPGKFLTESLFAIFFTLIFPVIYLIAWYFPNRNFYNQVMFEQTTRRFEFWSTLHHTVEFNFSGMITDSQNLILLAGLVIAIIIIIRSMGKGTVKLANPMAIVFGGVWLFIELHKLGMTYLPQRYLLSVYAAVAFFSGAVLSQVFWQRKVIRFFLTLFLIVAIGVNGFSVYQSYLRRTFELQEINEYVQKFNWQGKTIAGVWAPGISWGTNAKTIPVWKGYHNPVTFFGKYNPELIVEEPNEGTSESFYSDSGFDLVEMSDSVRTFKLWRYDVNLYWLAHPPEIFPEK